MAPLRVEAATPGLPFTEDFSDTNLRDATLTTADWSTQEQGVLLALRKARFGAFAADITSGTDITADADSTLALAAGDVDGDGDVDLVAGNSGQRSRLYLNNGTSNPFSGITGKDITTEFHNTYSGALGDMDGDGDLDLVTGNNSQPNRLYLNNGTADPFGDAVGAAIGADLDATNAVALGDMDRDGDLDLLVGNSSQGNRLYLNNGSADPFSGVFYQDVTADESFTLSMALGDMDGDGDLDLVAGNQGQRNRLYLNNGTSSPFEGVAGSDISSDTQSTRALAVADMDGDGELDVVAGNDNQPNRLYLNNGTGAPFEGVSGVDITASQFQTKSVLPGDLDCDGDLDLVIIVSDNRNRFFLNNGTPTPFEGAAATSITTDSTQRSAGVLADMDLDGDLDVIAGNVNAANRLYLNNSNPDPFSPATGSDITSDTRLTLSIAMGDMDGDGDTDVVAGNSGTLNRLYLNNGTADPFAGVAGSDIGTAIRTTASLAVRDVDRDGDLDLVAGNVSQANRLYLNNGTSAPFAGVSGSDIGTDADSTRSVKLGDMDGDGDLDLVAGNFGQPNRLYLNSGTANPFDKSSDITSDADDTTSVALGDVDCDGDLDVVAGNSDQRSRLYQNDGSSTPFNTAIGRDITNDAFNTSSVDLGDLDRDGDLDIVAGNRDRPNRLYLNNGTEKPFSNAIGRNITPDADNTRSVKLEDMDGDGDLDVVAGNSQQTNRLYLHNGTADPFAGVTGSDITTDSHNTLSVAVGDVNGDGSVDVIAGNGNEPNRLYLNSFSPKPAVGWLGSDITTDRIYTNSVALGDVDCDGDPDLVAGNFSQRNRLYLNNGTSRPFEGVTGTDISADIDPTTSVALGDVDGDGDLDLVAGNGSGSIAVNHRNRLYLNNGTSDPFVGVSGQDINSDDHATYFVALGDMDGDGDLDMIAGNGPTGFSSGENRLYLNNGTSDPFAGVAGADITSDTHATSLVALGDLDGDGDLDLVAATFNGRNRLYLNNGTSDPFAGVTGSDITTNTGVHRSVALGDMDGDGDLDLVVGKGGRNRLYLNNGTADPFNSITGSNITNDSDNTNSVALGDVDGDGDLDVVAGNFGGHPSRLYLNNGTSTPFADVTGIDITDGAQDTSAIGLADMDGDGCLDIVAGNGDPVGQINRLYLRCLFHTAQGRATSLAVDGVSGDIPDATLTVTENRPPNTSADYWLSKNGGVNWRLAYPGSSVVFPASGSDLRWRAELKSLSPILSPRIMQVNLDSSVRPTPTETLSPTSTSSLTATPSNTITATPTSTSTPTFADTVMPEPTSTFTPIPSHTPTIISTATVTITTTPTGLEPSPTPSPTATETTTNSPTVTDSPTPTSSLTASQTITPVGPVEYDIFPDTPDGKINAGDLLKWLERLRGTGNDRSMLFDFARFWMSSSRR